MAETGRQKQAVARIARDCVNPGNQSLAFRTRIDKTPFAACLIYLLPNAGLPLAAWLAILLLPARGWSQNDQWFDSWVFQGRQQADYRQKLESQLEAQLAILNRDLELSDQQLEKIRTAGRGDICRFFRKVDTVRKKTAQMNSNQENIQELWEIIMPIQQTAQRGLLTHESLFRKVLVATLSDEQRRREQENEKANRDHLYAVLTRQTIAEMEQSVPLVSHQRQKLLDLLLAQEAVPLDSPGSEAIVGLQRLCKVPERELANILDPDQLRLVLQFRSRLKQP